MIYVVSEKSKEGGTIVNTCIRRRVLSACLAVLLLSGAIFAAVLAETEDSKQKESASTAFTRSNEQHTHASNTPISEDDYVIGKATTQSAFAQVAEVNDMMTTRPSYYEGLCSGDVNLDGIIDSADARMVLQYEIGLIEFTEKQWMAASTTHNHDICGGETCSKSSADGIKETLVTDSSDARRILQFEVGLIKTSIGAYGWTIGRKDYPHVDIS